MSEQEELSLVQDTLVTSETVSSTTMEDNSAEKSDGFSDRGAPYRSTVARKCREFYLRRLERTETLQRRWSMTTTTLMSEMKVDKDDLLPADMEDSSGVESEGSTCSGDGQLQIRRRSEPVKRLVNTNAVSTQDLCANVTRNENDQCEKIDNNSAEMEVNPDMSSDTINSNTGSDDDHHLPPLRKWNSTLDLAMHNLRQEITSLIAQDNDLFRQLLSLNDSIVELREQQKRNLELSQLEDDEDEEDEDEFDAGSRSPSLESLSDPDTSATTPSPASTLSSSCSSQYSRNNNMNNVKNMGNHHQGNSRRPALPSSMRNGGANICHQHHRHHGSHDEGRPRSSSSNLCLRCHSTSSGKIVAMPLLRRRAHSQATLNWKRDDFDSYDSGIHLQGAHSDSDHEIFV